MIRILHFADFHLGIENYGQLDPSTGLSSRVADFVRVLDHLVDVALRGDVDIVVFAGDAYRSRDPSLTYQREFSKRIARLAAAGIPVVLLVGNHDLPNAIGRATPMDIYEALAVERVHVFAQPESRVISTRRGALQIVGLPWVRRERFLSAEDLKHKSIDELDLELNETLGSWIRHEAEKLDPDVPAVLMAHATIHGATLGSERKVLTGRDLTLTSPSVDLPQFSYVAMGHIHKHQVLGSIRPIVYPGSTERIDFGEEHEAKGFMLVDVQARDAARLSFQSLAVRPFLTVHVELTEESPTETVLAALRDRAVAGTILRVVVEGTSAQLKALSRTDVHAAAREAHYFAGIQQVATRDERQRDVRVLGEGLAPQEALRLYFESRKLSIERMKKLLALAEELISAQSI